MKVNPHVFREYDIRGVADRDLTDDFVFALGRSFGSLLAERGVATAVVGRDVRTSSPRIHRALTDGLRAAGRDVIDLGMVPTPVFYFALHHYDQDGGVMITGSHNPREFNGFKVCAGRTPIYGAAIQDLRRRLEEERFASGAGSLRALDPVPEYVDQLQQRTTISRGLRCVFDPGNGTAGVLLEQLCAGIGIEPVFINLEPDGTFPAHLPDPTVPEYLADLRAVVAETDADLGIGFDGDADRIGAIDEAGAIVWGDKLLGLYAQDIVARHPGAKVIFDVKCSQGLVEFVRAIGGTPIMYKTGHSLIKARMKEEHALVAGEMSGHMFFAEDYYGFDDAFCAALRLLRIVAADDRPLSALVAQMPHYLATPEIRIDCPDETKFEIVKRVGDELRKRYETIDIDGVRVVFPDGWGLLRASNTQPVLVLRFEARTEERLKEIRELFFSRLRAFPGVTLPS